MTQSLPSRPSLEHLKNQAKTLLRAAISNEQHALARFAQHIGLSGATRDQASDTHRNERDKSDLKLANAQFVIAREYGFSNWADLKQHVEIAEMEQRSQNERVRTLVEYCLGGEFQRVDRILHRFPDLATADIFVASMLGEFPTVQAMLTTDPALVHASGGPLNAVPLVYACSSRFAAPTSRLETNIRAVVRELLRHGADPNAFWLNPHFGNCPLSSLYGACGANGNAAIAKLLLDAGATPNDNESLYHSVEHVSTECTELLLQYGATIAGTNAIHNAVGLGNLNAVRLFLQHGADPNERLGPEKRLPLLFWAIECNQGSEMLNLLIEHGASVDAATAHNGVTVYRHAIRCGHQEAIEILADRGTTEELSTHETFLAACMVGNETLATQLQQASPDIANAVFSAHPELLNAVAWRGNISAVRTLLALGVDIASTNAHRATALHAAAWKGHVEIVRLLLRHNAPLDVKETEFDCTPLEWALHGSQHCHPHLASVHADAWQEQYAQIVDELLKAGSPRPVDRLVRFCRGPVEETLTGAGIFLVEQDD